MSTPAAAFPVAILGAGVAGASAARALAGLGFQVTVYDKGRVPGGRAATRSRASEHHDHGAQYFTARDAAFLQQVQDWAEQGVVAPWQPRLAVVGPRSQRSSPTGETRWVGVPGMNALAANLVQGLDLRCHRRIAHAERRESGWWLDIVDGAPAGPYAALLCTLPAPQAAELLVDEPLARMAGAVRFAPCWALMIEFDRALPVDVDAAFVNVGPLSWIARDACKPGRPDGERWTIHAGSEFSREHLEASGDRVAELLLVAFFSALDCAPRAPIRIATHRWRYALAEPPLHVGALVDGGRRLALGGDWCQGSRIEGAWLSGQALARQVREWAATP